MSFIELKRAEGFKYISEERMFKRIDTFFIENDLKEKVITKELADKWCTKKSYEKVRNQKNRITSFRLLARYLSDTGYDIYVPPTGLKRNAPKYDAHIYTDDELKRFFKAVDLSRSLPFECPYRADVLPVFFRILYTSGLRVSELRLLKIKDFNLNEGYITIHEGKNHKDRIVPVHPDLVSRCIELKNKIHLDSDDDEYFFMIRPGTPMTLQNVYHNFRRFLEKAGISHTGEGPRIHDFRHTYCVNLLRKWVEEEKDLLNYLPYMKTMLGHETFNETAYYLKLTSSMYPDLIMKLDKHFPNMITEVTEDGKEFY